MKPVIRMSNHDMITLDTSAQLVAALNRNTEVMLLREALNQRVPFAYGCRDGCKNAVTHQVPPADKRSLNVHAWNEYVCDDHAREHVDTTELPDARVRRRLAQLLAEILDGRE